MGKFLVFWGLFYSSRSNIYNSQLEMWAVQNTDILNLLVLRLNGRTLICFCNYTLTFFSYSQSPHGVTRYLLCSKSKVNLPVGEI